MHRKSNRLIHGLAAALLIVGALVAAGPVSAADSTANRILFVYDSSNSMWGALADDTRKYEAAREALASALSGDLRDRQIGLRAYGHRRSGDCRDSELVVPFGDGSQTESLNEAMLSIRPTGKTPITYSLREGLKDLDGGPGEILLISDGVETCDIDPCDLMREWRDAEIDVRVHVVGVGLNELERTAMSCIAQESGGVYFDADSSEGFSTALQSASEAIISAEQSTALGSPQYAVVVRPRDAAGRRYVDAHGQLFQDEALVLEKTVSEGRGRNIIPGPGDYRLEVGVVLRDGSIYRPVSVPVSVEDPGDSYVDVEVEAPARVEASFTERGEAAQGALVRAYQNGEELFRFRPSDTAYARPGTYRFTTEINQDNALEVTAELRAGETTELNFELIRTVHAYIAFEMPDGSIKRRNSSLWRNGELIYTLHGGNGGQVRPGVYELRSDDQNHPLEPREIVIDDEDRKSYTVPIATAWIRVVYPDAPFGYTSTPDRAWLGSDERGGESYAVPDRPIPVAPGRYTVRGFDRRGFFEPVSVLAEAGDSVDAVLTPETLGELIVEYAPTEQLEKLPQRAVVASLDGHPILGAGYFRPGDVRRLKPGRYRIEGYARAGNFVPQTVEIRAAERQTVTLHLAEESD